MFLVIAACWVFFGPVTLDRADKLDGARDYNFTVENYSKALEPKSTANHGNYNQ